MFVGYPAEASRENWLHESLVGAIHNIHAQLDTNQAESDWLLLFPPERRNLLASRPGLQDRLAAYRAVAEDLPKEARKFIEKVLGEQNRIAELLACAQDCGDIEDLPSIAQVPLINLFDFGFYLLGELGIRDRAYQKIFEALPRSICPFCAWEPFEHPKLHREDFDHYLPKTRYPLAGANLINLVPMGSKCNTSYKGQQDILIAPNGNRRRAFFPYGAPGAKVSLEGSAWNLAASSQPSWSIKLEPDIPECETWDQIFRIKKRLELNHLAPRRLNEWLTEFAGLYQYRYTEGEVTRERLLEVLSEFVNASHATTGLGIDFLKESAIRQITRMFEHGNPGVEVMMKSLVTHGSET